MLCTLFFFNVAFFTASAVQTGKPYNMASRFRVGDIKLGSPKNSSSVSRLSPKSSPTRSPKSSDKIIRYITDDVLIKATKKEIKQFGTVILFFMY